MKPASAERATNARFWVLVFAVSLAILSYVSRVCISQCGPLMMRDLHLSQEEMGQVFGSFGLAYALFEIPSGWLGDWIGPRKVLIRIVLWWSAFTALTGWMWSLTSLWVTRFLFGAGEAGAFPNLTKVFTTWLPRRERLRAQSVMWTAARWAGAVTPKIVVITLLFMSWRWAFVFFGSLGVIWCVFFMAWFRDDPHTHPGVNAAEAAIIGEAGRNASGHGNVPWGRLLASRSVWLLWAQYFCLSFPWYFYITWLPDYLQKYWKVTPSQSGTLAVLPLFLGGLGCAFCGWISRHVTRALGSVTTSRRLLASTGFAGAAVLLVIAIHMHTPVAAMVAMGFASFCNDLAMPPSWAACMDVGGKYAGTVSGSMNMMGNLAGYAAPVVGGYIVHGEPARYVYFLYLMAAVYLLGTFCWPWIDPVTSIDEQHA
ncbi:MAG TPA: MFS transporter [Bryobacteraceae bacterium]|nr:MFS transporter [Bryobacteraceae bacterium]